MILVTGGTGLTGRFVIEELLRRGHEVRVLRRAGSLAKLPAGTLDIAGGDLRDPESLRRATRGVDAIVHAAYTDGGRAEAVAVDVSAMCALLDGWHTGPFVFLSSLDVYGFAGPDMITEDTPPSESYGAYAFGKVLCERLLTDAATRAGRTDYVALRAPYIWGPHPTARKRLMKHLDPDPIVLPGVDPAEWREYQDVWIDARDLAAVVAELIERPAGGPLNVLTGHFVWHDLYAELIRLTGIRRAIEHRPLHDIGDEALPRKQRYAQRWRFSEDRLQRHFRDHDLAVHPRRLLETTLHDTVMCDEPA